MNNKDVSTHMNTLKTLRRRDDGMTMISTLAGLVVAGIVLTALAIFWINSNQNAKNVTDVSAQEAAGLRVLNSAAKDISNADPVVYADGQTVVVDNKKSGGKNRVRIRLDSTDPENLKIVRDVNSSPPSGSYNPSTSFPTSGGNVKSKVLAERAKNNEPLFTYFDKKGKKWTAEAATTTIARVDIKFKADAGKGYVELETKAAVRAALGNSGEPGTAAACLIDPTGSINGSNDPVLTWDGASTGAKNYRIVRGGTVIGTVNHTGPGTHTYTDTNAAVGANVYEVQPVNDDDVVNTTCAPIVITKTIDPPVVSGLLSSGNANMTIRWAEVPGATGYRITYQEVDPASTASPKAVTGPVRTLNVTTDNGSASTGHGNWWWSKSGSTHSAAFAPGLGKQFRFSVISLANSGNSKTSNEFDLMNAPGVSGSVSAAPNNYSRNLVAVGKSTHEGYRMQAFRGKTAEAAATSTSPLINYNDTANGNANVSMSTSIDPGVQNVDIGLWYHNLVGGTADSANPNQKYLGYYYSYDIRKTNRGPRVAAAGQTLAQQEQTVLEGASAPRTSATALQYPADPDIEVRGTERAGVEDNDGSADGTNLIAVTKDTSRADSDAVVAKYYKNNGGWGDRIHVVNETGLPSDWTKVSGDASSTDDCTGPAGTVCIYDGSTSDARGAVKAGTRYFYKVYAENATGQSPGNWTTNTADYKAAYQRPAPVALENVMWTFWQTHKRPSLDTAENANGQAEGNRFTMSWHLLNDRNGDGWPETQEDHPQANQNKDYLFCAESDANCRYIVKRDNRDDNTDGFDQQRAVIKAGTEDYAKRTLEDYATGWGTRDVYAVQACNAGGCSSNATKNIDTYPGNFTASEDTSGELATRIAENFAVGYTGPSAVDGKGTLDWSEAATGTIADKTKFTRPVGASVNMLFERFPWEEDFWGYGPQWGFSEWQKGTSSTTPAQFRASPSRIYLWKQTASSRWDPSLTRVKEYTKRTPPPRIVYTSNVNMCYYNTGGTKYNSGIFGSRMEVGDRTHSPTLSPYVGTGKSSSLQVRMSNGNSGSASNWDYAVNRLESSPDATYNYTYNLNNGLIWHFTPTGGDSQTAAGRKQATQTVDYKMWLAQRYVRTARTVTPNEYVAWRAQNQWTTLPTGYTGAVTTGRTFGDNNTHIDAKSGTSNSSESVCINPSFAYIYEDGNGNKYTENVLLNSNLEMRFGRSFQAKMNTQGIPSRINTAKVENASGSYLPPATVPESIRGKPFVKAYYESLSYVGGNYWYVNN
ncbi:hypothetical protein [Aeromicrobium sp. 179-A 4D2 NHS]|uniref:hypothetical protein n=1 Tax=Aeromicrobium sp. 179-A 4D2 NHS TaxID=3142375 RepID=UPI0039A0069A